MDDRSKVNANGVETGRWGANGLQKSSDVGIDQGREGGN